MNEMIERVGNAIADARDMGEGSRGQAIAAIMAMRELMALPKDFVMGPVTERLPTEGSEHGEGFGQVEIEGVKVRWPMKRIALRRGGWEYR